MRIISLLFLFLVVGCTGPQDEINDYCDAHDVRTSCEAKCARSAVVLDGDACVGKDDAAKVLSMCLRTCCDMPKAFDECSSAAKSLTELASCMGY